MHQIPSLERCELSQPLTSVLYSTYVLIIRSLNHAKRATPLLIATHPGFPSNARCSAYEEDGYEESSIHASCDIRKVEIELAY